MRLDNRSAADIALLDGVIELVQREYVHPINADQLTNDALKGMLGRIDPHSDYMDEQEFQRSQGDFAGQFGGLGMGISEQLEIPKIVSPIDGTPAAHAGLQPGDTIVLIDHTSTRGVSLQKVVSLLRGDPGSKVTLTIGRSKDVPFDVTVTREIIHVKSVWSRTASATLGSANSAATPRERSRNAVNGLKHDANGNLNGIALDLRDDPGGLLSAAVDVAGDFLDGGPIVSIRGR
jgi:carboxyl-terminal processing protease